MAKNSPKRNIDHVIVTALLTILLFASPLTDWWAQSDMPWYLPYIVWLLVILLTALTHWRNPDQ